MRDRIFKGATRPAMMLGVPIMPCIVVMGTFFILAMWTLVFAGLVAALSVLLVMVFVVAILRFMTAQDDQRLSQYAMYLRSRAHKRNRVHWGAHSMSPIDFKKRGAL
jgi:type IV secretion system protein VirB3